MIFIDRSPSLSHYGVLGMKWGVRKDGMPQGYQGSGKGRSKNTDKDGMKSNSVIKGTFKNEEDSYYSIAQQVNADKAMKDDKRRSNELKQIISNHSKAYDNLMNAKTEKEYSVALEKMEKLPQPSDYTDEWAKSLLEENGIDPNSEVYIEGEEYPVAYYNQMLSMYIFDKAGAASEHPW